MTTSRIQYGWVIVGAMFVVQTMVSGLGFYNMSVYMTELAKQLQAPLADVSFAVSLFFTAGGIGGVVIAKWLDHFSIKLITTVALFTSAICVALIGQTPTLFSTYLLFAAFGAANTGLSLVVATTLITRWFPGSNRAVALSVASTGLSVGGIVITPASAYLFNLYGISSVTPWLGGAMVLLLLPITLFVVRWPTQTPEQAQAELDVSPEEYKRAIASRFFVWHSVAYIFCMGAQVGGIAHVYNLVENMSDFTQAALAVQIMTAASIVGRIAGGFVVSVVPVRLFTLGNLLLQVTGLLFLSLSEQVTLTLLGVGLFGLSVGNLLMLQPLWLAEAFPGPVYARVYALGYGLSVIGVASGPFFIGLMYDLDSYSSAYMGAALVSVLALGCILLAGLPENSKKSN